MTRKYSIVAVSLAFLVGLTAVFLFNWLRDRPSTDWLNTSIEQKHFGVSYATKALFGADIPFPDIRDIAGKTKFVQRNNGLNLGYVITVTQEQLDKSKVPAKYLKQKQVVIEGLKVAQEPIDQVAYEVLFRFLLGDRDGFELLQVESKPEVVYSGRKNDFQGVVQQMIPVEIANRVSQVHLNTHILRCLSCD